MSSYTATAQPVGCYWHIEVAGIGVTQARSAKTIESMARDLIESITDTPDAPVEISYILPETAVAHRERAETLRQNAAHAQEQAAREYRATVKELRQAGLSQPDIGVVLGISHQRVNQLLAS